MTDLSLGAYVAVAIAALLIGLSKAGFGGGLGPFITGTVALVLPAPVAVALLLPLLIVGDGFALAALWGRWDTRHIWLLLPGSIIGVAAGTYLIAQVSSEAFARVLGAIVLVFVAFWLLEPRLQRIRPYRSRRWHGVVAGTVAGFTSALAHSGSPPVAMYLLLQGLAPSGFAATSAVLFAAINLIKVPAYLSAGLFDWGLQLRLAWAALLIPVGIVAGRMFVDRIRKAAFNRVLVGLLAVTGILLVLE